MFVRDQQRGLTRRVSVANDGGQANGPSYFADVSPDGRYVTFMSDASNLVAGDTNNRTDVFVRDRVNNVTRRVSVGPGGAQANGASALPSMSADGRYVAFSSFATNLVAGETSAYEQCFVRDRVAHVTTRVSVAQDGGLPNDGCWDPEISANGEHVAFVTYASNLIDGDTNGALDVFVRDRVDNVTTRVSVGPGGAQAISASLHPTISADGRYVAFDSNAMNLVAGDTNGVPDVFVRDQLDETTSRISVGSGDTEADRHSGQPSISVNGRYVAFRSQADLIAKDTNGAADVYVRDLVDHSTGLVSIASGGRDSNGPSAYPDISATGRYVAFASRATTLVPQDTNGRSDVFVRDRG